MDNWRKREGIYQVRESLAESLGGRKIWGGICGRTKMVRNDLRWIKVNFVERQVLDLLHETIRNEALAVYHRTR